MTVKDDDFTKQQRGQEGGRVAMDVNDDLLDLNGVFKDVVTSSIEEILQKRPDNPIFFLADRLLMMGNDVEMESIEYVVGCNTHCTLTKACTRKDGAEVLHVPGLPLMKLLTPTTFEMDAALRHMNEITSQKSKIIIFVEPPCPATDLFFVKGVPYFTDVTEKILQQRRRGICEEAIDRLLGSPGNIISLVQSALQMNIKTLQEEIATVTVPASRYSVVEFPQLQCNPLEVFDTISSTLGLKKFHWDEQPEPITEVPGAIFLSFNPKTSGMTFSRIIAAMLPLHEQVQYGRIATTLEKNRLRIQKPNYRYITEYWEEVLRRRGERDEARGGLNFEGSRRKTSRISSRHLTRYSGRSQQTEMKGGGNGSSNTRAQRREKEDTAFLHVLQQLQSQAAVRIQALYRGYRSRKKMAPRTAHRIAADNTPSWVEDLPSSLPILLKRCLQRLSSIHGELFGNYVASCPPMSRCVTVIKPLRKVLRATGCSGGNGSDDTDSETEEWEEEQVVLPLARLAKPRPHFNVLRRLMECEYMGGCNTIKYAMGIHLDCTGLSVLQRRAYDCYKSLVLNMLYIAFLELYHRRLLSHLVTNFSEYVWRFHADVFLWFSTPHFFSRIALRYTENTSKQVPILCSMDVVESERVLLACAHGEGKLYIGPQRKKMQKQTRQEREGKELPLCADQTFGKPADIWDCWGVYAAPAFLSETSWNAALKKLASEKHGNRVAWWSLHPNPAAYIAGEPVVLIPRHELQQVEGRPSYDELVPRVEETKAKATASSVSVHNRARMSSRMARSRRYSGVNDGLLLSEKPEVDPTPTLPAPIPVTSPLPEEGESLLSPFGVSLRWEDYHLALGLSQEMETNHFVKAYIYSKEPSASPSHPTPIAQSSLREFFLSPFNERKVDDRLPEENLNLSGMSLLGSRIGAFRSGKPGQWFKAVENPKRSAIFVDDPRASSSFSRQCASRDPITRKESSHRRCGSNQASFSAFVDVQCVDGMAHRVARHAIEAESFVHLRPWILPVCGRAWPVILEKFTSKCLAQMREGYTLILAVDQPFQLTLFIAVCLLRHGLMHPPKLSSRHSDTTWDMNNFTPPLPKCGRFLLSEDAFNCLSFMHSFYEEVNKLVRYGDPTLHDSVYALQNIIQANSPGGMSFLEELPTLIRSAERETDRRILEETILTIVQRVELYCWLVLFQTFLSSDTVSDIFDKDSKKKISSFAYYVSDSSVMTWIDRIDPWQETPERSPDPFHLRYSNGMRRWDDRHYIYHGSL